jgi:tripartite-type tricarboxylate transporter receptor subunit TctC
VPGPAHKPGEHAQEHAHPSARIAWARLLKRVFDIDLEHCPQCGGEFRIIAAIEEPEVVARILTHLGLPARAPPRFPPRWAVSCNWPRCWARCLSARRIEQEWYKSRLQPDLPVNQKISERTHMNWLKFTIALVASVSGVTGPAAAAYPERPVRVVIPFAPGGGLDIITRLTSKSLGESWKQSLVIDNRQGANGLIGMEIVARAEPNGYTLMAMASGRLDAHNLKYFSPIALFSAPPSLLVVHPSVKAATVKELVALAKSQSGKFNYASTGSGAVSHLAFELFKSMTGVEVNHIPYKGIGQAIPDLLSGRVEMTIGPAQAMIPYAKSGKLRALGVTSAKRLGAMPELPTVAESGLPGYESYGWFGLFAPRGASGVLVASINADVRRALQSPDIVVRLAEAGAEPATYTPGEFLAFIVRDNARWEKVIQEKNIQVERPRLNLR